MRVLCVGNMYPPHSLGGYELTWRSAVQHLRGLGHEVRVLTTDYRLPGLSADGAEPDVHRELRWYWHDHEYPERTREEVLDLERHNARVLDEHLSDLRPDAVNWWAMGGMSLSMIERVRRAGLPAVGVVGDDWMVYAPKVDAWMSGFAERPDEAEAAERATGIPTRVEIGEAGLWLFNSENVRRRAYEERDDLADTEVAYPGIDTELFGPAAENPWRWRLLYLGRIDRRKGIDIAVEALPLLPEDATLAVVGAGDDAYLAELHELARARGVGGRVAFSRCERGEVPAVYAQADALVFPVRWREPWGLVPLEAMAVGTPVVATGTGGSGEYLAHERNCLIFAPESGPEGLAAALRRLHGDEELRRRLREDGFRTASRFTEHAYNDAIAAAIARAGR